MRQSVRLLDDSEAKVTAGTYTCERMQAKLVDRCHEGCRRYYMSGNCTENVTAFRWLGRPQTFFRASLMTLVSFGEK